MAAILAAASGHAAVVASCGFESSGDTWSYTASGGGTVNASFGDEDSPANQRIRDGDASWTVNKASSTLVFQEILLSGWTNVTVRYHISSTAASGGSGATAADIVAAYVATTTYDNLKKATFRTTADITLAGYGDGATWGYDSGAAEQIRSAGGSSSIAPAGDGLRTDDGYTDFAIQIPSGRRSVSLKLYLSSDGSSERWNLDDVTVEGIATTSDDRWWSGSGTWNNSTTTCWASSAGSLFAWKSANGDNAYFADAGGTATIAAGTLVAARSLSFDADGYVIAAGDSTSKLALTNGGSGGAGANTIAVADGCTAAILATIVANPGVGLTKTGDGTLVLGGVNTYTGATTVAAGTLRLTSAAAIGSCSTINLAAGATLDVSPIAGGFCLGESIYQQLSGAGTILGDLTIGEFGIHNLGNSPGVQSVQGDYLMNGVLETEINGDTPGSGGIGYDQVLITGNAHEVSLNGALDLVWSGTDWAAVGDCLWIVRNDTAGLLDGTFLGYANGNLVGNYDGCSWRIYYGADADSGLLSGGNDVLLIAVAAVPEPSSLALAAPLLLPILLWRRRLVRTWHRG